MDYISVSQAAEKWGLSERSIRNYCQQGRIVGAVLNGHSWLIPENAVKPDRKKRSGKVSDNLLSRLRIEKETAMTGGIYHKIQIELTYNSIIEDDIKEFYYRGLQEWKNERGYLRDTCLTAQDRFRKYLDYFGIKQSG